MFYSFLMVTGILLPLAMAGNCSYSFEIKTTTTSYLCEDVSVDEYVYYLIKFNPEVQKLVGSHFSLVNIDFIKCSISTVGSWITAPMSQSDFWQSASSAFNFSNCWISSIDENAFYRPWTYSYINQLDLSYNNVTDFAFMSNIYKYNAFKALFLKDTTVEAVYDLAKYVTYFNDGALLDISHSNITVIDLGSVSYLNNIELSYSNVETIIGPFQKSPNSDFRLTLKGNDYLTTLVVNSSDYQKVFLGQLHLSNSVGSFPFGILKNVSVYGVLSLTGSNIPELDQNLFELNEAIYRETIDVDLSNVRLSSVSENYFNGYVLKTLNLSNNHIEILENNVFAGASIDTLDLSKSLISKIKNTPFRDLVTDILNLSKNNISSLENSFQNTTVTSLDLSDNPIIQMDSSTFQNCKNLMTLNLANTFISQIGDNAFSQLMSLRSLEISYFGSINATQIKNAFVTKLTISNSQISTLQDNNFNGFFSLSELHLNNTVINKIENLALKNLFNLQYLDTQNLFKFTKVIPKEFFSDLGKLRTLELFNLDFESFEAGAFDGLTSLNHLNVTGSSLENDFKFVAKLLRY